MASPVPQHIHRDQLLDSNRAVIARIRGAVSDVPPDAMTWQPPAGGWSIAEVLEHLIVSADSYLRAIRDVLRRKGLPPVTEDSVWKPSLAGGLLVGSFRSPRKLPAPKMYKPGPVPRPRVLEEFVQRQEEAGRLIVEASQTDWRRVRLSSPVISLLRMNLGDALSVLVTHAERHAAQIERVKAQQAVPFSMVAK